MGLKQDIVVVNKYTVLLPSGKGSRGSTPGNYVTRYMARELATETLAPIRRNDTDDFIQRYMARESATERLDVSDVRELKRFMGVAQGDGGVSFGYGQVSLSDGQLKSASKDIQRLFDDGHTVMKTVLSFDQEYLRRRNIIPEDFQCERRGDYRGNIDQMKLRMAVMHGLSRMNSAIYDDLRYVAVIQVDTEHVHCHLAMADAGEGRLAADGTQKGKVNERAKSFLRRGMDSWLDDKQAVKHLSSAVGYERRNVTTFVKRWAHQQMMKNSLPQFLLATLPEDRRMWRSNTNHEAMRKPNRIVRQMVKEVLDKPDSPMVAAMSKVHEYAGHRRDLEGLGQEQYQRLVDTGRDEVIERGVNGVYALLRQLPEDALAIKTPMLDTMGMDYEQLAVRAKDAGEDDLIGFGFRLRSYSARLEHHTEQREHYHERSQLWEITNEAGGASEGSRALYEFYLEEEEYHARVAAKYRRFLSFAPPSTTWYDQWNKVADYGERMLSLESMRKDQSLRKMKDLDAAEGIGREVYGQAGGHLVSKGDKPSLAKLDSRIAKMRTEYDRKVSDLKVDLAGQGLRLDVSTDETSGRDVAEVSAGAEYPFEDVKALDMHNMRYDFNSDVEIGARSRSLFLEQSRKRTESLNGAVTYLETSGQADVVQELPVADVRSMSKLAQELADGGIHLPSQVEKLARSKAALRRSHTVTLSRDLSDQVVGSVERSVMASTPLPELDEPLGIEGPAPEQLG